MWLRDSKYFIAFNAHYMCTLLHRVETRRYLCSSAIAQRISNTALSFLSIMIGHIVSIWSMLFETFAYFSFLRNFYIMLHQFSGENWAIKSKKCWLFSIFANQILELTKVIYHFHTTYRVDSLLYIFWVLPHWYCWDIRGTSKWLFFRIFEVFIFKSKLHPNNASYIKMFMMVNDC